MSYYGKIFCTLIGFHVAGLLGALVGFIIGHFIDSEETYGEMPRQKKMPFQRRKPATLEEKHLTFFVCVFSMLAKLARADGAISPEEISVVHRFMKEELSLDPARVKLAQNIFRSARLSKTSFEEHAKEFFASFQQDAAVLESLLDILLRLSSADGGIVQAEERMIRDAARIFRFPDETFERLRSRYVATPDRNYQILGCTKNSSPDEIKKAYRKLAMENHPDRIRAQGQPEEFIALANDKFRAIQEAYEAIQAEKGFS